MTHAFRPSARALPAVLALACALISGCASTPPPPHFDPADTRLVPFSSVPALDVSGLPGGKAMGTGVGAGTGSGAGAVAGAAACLAAGPLFPLCILAVVPTSAAIGAVTGGVIGAVRTESVTAVAFKTRVLADELAATPYQALLAQRLQEQTGIASMPDRASPDARPWTLEVGVVEVGTEGKGEFAMRLVARMRLRQGDTAPVWQTAKEVQSDTELTIGQWMADDSKALRNVLDRCIAQAAHQLASDLVRAPDDAAAKTTPRAKYSSSCKDTPATLEATPVPPRRATAVAAVPAP